MAVALRAGKREKEAKHSKSRALAATSRYDMHPPARPPVRTHTVAAAMRLFIPWPD
ncbi:hypothetical protein K431DRAFT_286225 [Polychaeton citri CBS 116435]|uniref:Uncharacterized protein n=1 Tax=Polychaeton citri CBS 116435 TaxID=1314669 RepID=A0A9P4Q833_9PEZI|nr:hypothetical protein K431DRAFT_286225 [Polychaeton citri CBS 116435]